MTATSSKTLVKGIEILRGLAQEREPLSLADLASQTGFPKPTLLRVLSTLVNEKLLEQVDGRYRLGVGCLSLGQAYLEGLDLRSECAPALRQLSQTLNETCHLGVLNDLMVVYVDKVEGAGAVRMHSSIGATNPLYCTGIGKALLAYSAPELVARVVEAGLAQRTKHTLKSGRSLRADLELIRRRGYSIDNEENELGIRCAAAVILDHEAQPIAALSTSIPIFRFPDSEVERIGGAVRDVAQRLSLRFGLEQGRHTTSASPEAS